MTTDPGPIVDAVSTIHISAFAHRGAPAIGADATIPAESPAPNEPTHHETCAP